MLRLVLFVFFTVPTFLTAPFLYGYGFKSLASGRNVGTEGIVQDFTQSALQRCFANVSFLVQDISFNGVIKVPCEEVKTNATLPIAICYNHHNPVNFAYDDEGQHAVDTYYGTKNPWGFCSRVGYGSAKTMVHAAYALTGIFGMSIFAITCWPKTKIAKDNRPTVPPDWVD